MLHEYFSVKIAVSSFFIALLAFLTLPVLAHEGEDHGTTTPTSSSKQLQTAFEVTATGTSNWQKSIASKDGDEVTWRFSYKNTGTAAISSVVVKANIPNVYAVVPGGVQWFDANHASGYSFSDTAVFSQGVSLGNLPVGANGYLRIRTKVSTGSSACTTSGTASGTVTYDNQVSNHTVTVSLSCAPTTVASRQQKSVQSTPQVQVAQPKVQSAVIAKAGNTNIPATGPNDTLLFIGMVVTVLSGILYKRKIILTKQQK